MAGGSGRAAASAVAASFRRVAAQAAAGQQVSGYGYMLKSPGCASHRVRGGPRVVAPGRVATILASNAR